jgi:large subunit ribosomal protein L25
MSEVTLTVETDRPMGSRAARRLRRDGKIPGVLYGHGVTPTPLAVDARELRHALNTDAGLNALLDLDLAGAKHLAMARQIQRHPVRGSVTHVDFIIVRRDEVITADVPISLVGDAKAIKEDGVVDQQLFALTIKAMPGNIPNVIEVDVTELGVGDSIRISDLTLPAGVETELDPETTIVSGQATVEEAAPEVEGEVAEGEAAEGAEGEAPAGEAASAEGEGSSGGESEG